MSETSAHTELLKAGQVTADHIMKNGASVEAGSSYTLLRDCKASARLTAQHYLCKDLLGFLVHPTIPTRTVDLRVADVATGNGIWLYDLSRHVPDSVKLHGFDLSLDQVGPRPWLPTNIQMHTWDIFEEPDPEFAGYFDVVHVRLIFLVIRGDDPRPVLANLTKLLRPGGYLQWDEVDTIGWSVRTVPGASGANLGELGSQIAGRDRWKSHFTQIMEESGYEGPSVYVYEPGLGMARLWNDVLMGAWKEFAENVLDMPEASRELERRSMGEARGGAALMVPMLVWVGKKA